MKIINIVSNTRLLILMTAFLLVSGFSSFNTLPRAEDPVISNRFATVTTSYPGASAERVEALVTEVVENKLRELSEIKLISSTSRPGVSIINIELNDEITHPDPVWSKARDKLSDTPPLLPVGTFAPEFDSDHTYAFTLITALIWQGSSDSDLLTLGRYAKELSSQLRALSGTEFVDSYGMPKEEILVSLDTSSAVALGNSSASIAQSLDGADAKNSAGELVNGHSRFGLEIASDLNSLERIRQVPIAIDAQGHRIRLEDVATVTRTQKTPAGEIAIIDGKPGVIVAARMQSNLRVDKWTPRARALIEHYQQQLPSNIKVETLFSQQGYTQTRLSDLSDSLLLGFSIILVVLLLTLGFRAAIMVAVALPLTSMLTLMLMKFTGIPINQMSVTGLIVALGIMVDNAVVMVDTIQTYRLKGKAKLESALMAIEHLWVPLLGSTLTTILAFAPIFLMPGASGEFVGAIAITVSFSLIGSYIISHTIIAGFAVHFLPSHSSSNRWYHTGVRIPPVTRAFSKTVSLAIRRPLIAIALVVSVPVAGYVSLSQLTEQFFPPSDRDMFEVQVYLSPQASIYATENVAEEVDKIIRQYQGVEQVNWLVGGNFPSFYYNLQASQSRAPYFAQAMVKTDTFQSANDMIVRLQRHLNQAIPNAQILVRKLEQGPPFKAPIELRIYGDNLDQLKSIGEDIRLILANTQHVTHTRETLQPGTPKVWLDIDEDAAKLNNMTLTDVANLLQSSLVGRESGSIIEASESIPVRVRVGDSERENMSHLSNLRLPIASEAYSTGMSISTIAKLSLTPSRGAIPRRNGQRVNTIEGYIEAGVLPQTVLNDFQSSLERYSLPTGYRVEFGGESAERDESVNSLMANLAMVITLMILVVVLSFNSFRLSNIIFSVAWLSAGLGILSVYLFGYPFGFTVIIAMLGIVGLAINAAIVILAELKASPKACQGDENAILEAVMSCTRHITSTTITTVGGFLPLIIAGGGFWPPFAIAIAGGTTLTTLISFYFVPALFKLLMRKDKPKNNL
ncbi:hypothetical protein VHA01S_010_00390 [Vibrio halioticoli NBRC 102217]|uniref:Acriflavin resistance protein n=1 Tax=Vibrio halioticoli NBRC 102217 TaxID=1219072 RepID=V5FBU6_9VIBR|nr:efflux RND transporter permease subunit [Vibrio halioticoli]GAD88813.1 hypothetical protein VHA01S_010_00390 [Vibrio halioticoli NBRC 102217]